jgi:periplasmic protein TonB
MPIEDAPADDAPAAGSVGLPAPAESAAAAYPIASTSAPPLQPRWPRPTIAFVVILIHASALIALATVSRPAPPAEETVDVEVVAAGDESPVTTSAAEPARSRVPGEPAPQPSAPAEEEPSLASAPEPSASLDAPPPAAAPQEAPSPSPPPPDAPPPAAEAPPAPAPPTSIEAQVQPLPPPPDVPSAAVAVQTPAVSPPTSVEAQPQSPLTHARPDQVRTQSQPRPEARASLEPAERPRQRAKAETAERPKQHNPIEGGSSASANASLSKPGSADAQHVGEANGRAVDVGMSRASYAALLVAQIQAHKFYPESARARGEQGAVGVSFTIGSSGRVGSAAVVRSSGFTELDSAAREILHSISPPPPPGGSFSASTTIRFHFD